MSASEAGPHLGLYQAGQVVQDFYCFPEPRLARARIAAVCPEHENAAVRTTYKMVSRRIRAEYMYVADGTNNVVWILDRKTGKTLGFRSGGNGKYAGQSTGSMRSVRDSKGNIYTGEVERPANPEVRACKENDRQSLIISADVCATQRCAKQFYSRPISSY